MMKLLKCRKSLTRAFLRHRQEADMKEEIFVPSPLAEQLEKAAEEQGVTVDELAEKAIRNYIRSGNDGK